MEEERKKQDVSVTATRSTRSRAHQERTPERDVAHGRACRGVGAVQAPPHAGPGGVRTLGQPAYCYLQERHCCSTWIVAGNTLIRSVLGFAFAVRRSCSSVLIATLWHTVRSIASMYTRYPPVDPAGSWRLVRPSPIQPSVLPIQPCGGASFRFGRGLVPKRTGDARRNVTAEFPLAGGNAHPYFVYNCQ